LFKFTIFLFTEVAVDSAIKNVNVILYKQSKTHKEHENAAAHKVYVDNILKNMARMYAAVNKIKGRAAFLKCNSLRVRILPPKIAFPYFNAFLCSRYCRKVPQYSATLPTEDRNWTDA
jgi:hypothetical protein